VDVKSLRIALVTPEYAPESGGIGANAAVVATGLLRHGHQPIVVTSDPAFASSNDHVTVLYVRRRTGAELLGKRLRRRLSRDIGEAVDRLLTAREAARRALAASPDLVVASEWDAQAWWIARFTRLPVVTRLASPMYRVSQADGLDTARYRVQCWFERDQAARSTLVHALSREMAHDVERDWQLAPERIAVVPNPVDVERVRRSAASPTFALPPRFFAYTGRLETRKGIWVLASVLSDVLRAHPDMHAVLVGNGDPATRTKIADAARDVADRVHVLGALPWPEMLGVVARAELMVFPALWESFPNVALEAMALGRPIVAGATGGLAEVVEHGRTGWLVAPGDAAALADTLIDALNEPERLRRFGEAAATSVARYDADRVVHELIAVYERAISLARRGRLGPTFCL
jgi:glycogen synthase